MTIQDMHYDFNKKLNKVNSNSFRNLTIPEIDWTLNEAQELFIKLVANPKLRNGLGFETTQRTIDDIRTLVKEDFQIKVTDNIAKLPIDYYIYVSSFCKMQKGKCIANSRKTFIRRHNDDFENSIFDKSSFEWRTVNAVFNNQGIKLFTEDFTIEELCMTYISKPNYIHNAQSFRGGKYQLPSGKILSGTQDCELPESTHREIVDIAVMIVSGELQLPDFTNKHNKVSINQNI